MEELYALSPFKPIFIAKSAQGVGDFQVAIGGGFWVAVRATIPDIIVQQPSGFLITVRSLLGMLHDEDK
jgi:hypothetical protein